MSTRRLAAGLAASLCALALTPAATAQATPSWKAEACSGATAPLSIVAFNDFHGRVATSRPDTVAFFGTVEQQRAQAGEKNTLLVSSGDNIGASLFASALQDDNPTLDMMNAMDVDTSAVGNHELDKGWTDFTGRVSKRAEFPYLAANLFLKGTTAPAAQQYTIVERNGLKVAVIGAITSDLKSLVSPTVFEKVDLGDPVAAVNKAADELTDGNAANGEADVVVASYHDGSNVSEPKALDEALAYENFNQIVTRTSPKVAAILNAHTHQTYAYNAPIAGTDRTRPVLQSASYGSLVGRIDLVVDAQKAVRPGDNKGKGKGAVKDPGTAGTICSASAQNVKVLASDQVPSLVAQYPRVAEVQKITTKALADAQVIGARVVAKAPEALLRTVPVDASGNTTVASLSDVAAQMFHDTLAAGKPNVIGIQNPGGTRADLNAGDITYADAAAVLPFANSLMTTQLTGTQVRAMLEQQWQPGTTAGAPTRFLKLGVSDNLQYTYDDTRPVGSRIIDVTVEGKPLDPTGVYTMASGNFLISGGDNFSVLAQGTDKRDTGASDLAAWIDWLTAEQTIVAGEPRQARA